LSLLAQQEERARERERKKERERTQHCRREREKESSSAWVLSNSDWYLDWDWIGCGTDGAEEKRRLEQGREGSTKGQKQPEERRARTK
jgi:hypothetical protein